MIFEQINRGLLYTPPCKKILFGTLVVLLLTYGALGSQALPEWMYGLLQNNAVKFVILSAIAILSLNDVASGLMLGLIFLLAMHYLNNLIVTEAFRSSMNKNDIRSCYYSKIDGGGDDKVSEKFSDFDDFADLDIDLSDIN